jgi:hypothetical protein
MLMALALSGRNITEIASHFVLAKASLCKWHSRDMILPFNVEKRKSSLGGPFQFSTCLDVVLRANSPTAP